MERYAAGDDAAFAELYDTLAPRLYAALLERARDPALAEDLLQQTFLNIHLARGSFIRGSDVVPWAYAIAHRLFVDAYRRRRRDPLLQVGAPDSSPRHTDSGVEDEYIAQEWARRLQRTLDNLPRSQREAFELLRFEGTSHQQAAEILGATITAVKLRAHRAYRALRATLDEPQGPLPLAFAGGDGQRR
jgi:RNA polymerase sigma-70 factor (ECF subfamily)